MIDFEDFKKVELRIGTILTADKVEGSEKLLNLKIDLGTETRQVLSGIAQWYSTKSLIGKQVVVVVNLKPRKMMGQISQGMILAVDDEKPILLKPFKKTPNGAVIT